MLNFFLGVRCLNEVFLSLSLHNNQVMACVRSGVTLTTWPSTAASIPSRETVITPWCEIAWTRQTSTSGPTTAADVLRQRSPTLTNLFWTMMGIGMPWWRIREWKWMMLGSACRSSLQVGILRFGPRVDLGMWWVIGKVRCSLANSMHIPFQFSKLQSPTESTCKQRFVLKL